MKLRNKITGEIRKGEMREDGIYLYDETTEQWYKYELDLLARCWEYYEEALVYYTINEFGAIESYPVGCISDEDRKLIGNYFETEEEAEKAVEKLKAWKRLKDKGFKFNYYDVYQSVLDECVTTHIQVTIKANEVDVKDELDLLFGGKE